MIIERPPRIFRLICGKALFRVKPSKKGEKMVYLTFDDGPIPESTPWVLDLLDRYGVKATFFMVGDNVRKYPELYRDVLSRGHRVGNHTMHHLQGSLEWRRKYVADVAEAAQYIESDLFRPPHGWLRPLQSRTLKRQYKIVMFDLVTRDYSWRLTAEDVYDRVRRYARPGSIIVFHDSLKSLERLRPSLARCIEWLQGEGYSFGLLK